MALESPLRDPGELLTKIIRHADFVFKIIFIVEMALKLIAMGLIWGKDTYLKSGWNWLDGIVVLVSILGMTNAGSGGALKTLRILRALRPLRVISRNENLKVVVQTIFASFPALVTLVIVCVVFLLIMALFLMSFLHGTFYSCQVGETPIFLEKELGDAATPLCLRPNISAGAIRSACPRGLYDDDRGVWIQDNLPCPWPTDSTNCVHRHEDMTLAWKRPSPDTPICVGRCVLGGGGGAPEWLCPRRYQSQAELPHNCPQESRTGTPEFLAAEEVGMKYIAAMQRNLVMPCAGTAVSSVTEGLVEDAASASSCREVFCPGEVKEERKTSCEANCKRHPHFCVKTCKSRDDTSPKCLSCRKECEAWCQCSEYCEPLIRDAALCVEQGGSWMPALPQNFNNVWTSLLTLFEISSTEGWVDVMYQACDARDPYQEPRRDHLDWFFAPVFVFYMAMSFMFLLNLSVGVIVDNFMDLKQTGTEVMLTPAQQRWLNSQKTLLSKAKLFHMRNLHLLPRLRRKAFELVSGSAFETFMTGAIVVNTLVMATRTYPWLTVWWEEMIQGLDIAFTAIFLIEFALKFYALRSHYWMDNWNRFDFLCVVAAVVGTILGFAAPSFELGKSLSQLFRIFRIARLFRLLRSARLNKIFMALVMSLPKLGNVLMILLLLLILYSILGVNLFATVKHSETLNIHGNFMDFGWAFITLFRTVTGEAWNSIMHDLLKGEWEFYREGTWCAPDEFFDTSTEESFGIMKSKCLLDTPNGCMQTLWGWNVLPAVFWVTYILFIQLLVMNLVIAVILEGYEDGKKSPESEIIDLCIVVWEKYDSDHKMTLPLPQALGFINEVITTWVKKQEQKNEKHSHQPNIARMFMDSSPDSVDRIPMRYASYFNHLLTCEDGKVHWLSASKQVIRFITSDNDADVLRELEQCEACLDKRTMDRLGRLEKKRKTLLGVQESSPPVNMPTMVATAKLQHFARRLSADKARTQAAGVSASAAVSAAAASGAGSDCGGGDVPRPPAH
eukprot:CAMPEP_0179027558 /NCGR_PEP_ID=MMETSP0796-20121207/9098_1 /TAXON_ID=73915 /ORGANISM="Pyrodinium bahamense, Strain pbaha01" /LENGTH=1012 /DNA_ID=CAMNT_0020723685 /DNA_START=8 /DNA_END=3046 /DNA_ORIENTATION=+